MFGKFLNRGKQVAENSDYGRKYGWFIEKNGEKVGDLDYVRWCEDTQFWHEYGVTWATELKGTDTPEGWVSLGLTLRNRTFTDVVIHSFMTAPATDSSRVFIRGASVDLERIAKENRD